jgi:hypothetical protein
LRSEAVQGVSAFALLDLNPLADDFEALLRGFAELLLARPQASPRYDESSHSWGM